MPGHDASGPVLDLEDLDPRARAWVEQLVSSGSLVLRESGRTVGTIGFLPAPADQPSLREGAKVLATTMELRPEARDRLRQSFGPEWVVLDFHDAPPTADVVLTAAHSPQLINRWTLMFPQAQVIVAPGLRRGKALYRCAFIGRGHTLPWRRPVRIGRDPVPPLRHGSERRSSVRLAGP